MKASSVTPRASASATTVAHFGACLAVSYLLILARLRPIFRPSWAWVRPAAFLRARRGRIEILTVPKLDPGDYRRHVLCAGCAAVIAEAWAALGESPLRAVVHGLGAAENLDRDNGGP